MVSSCCHGNHTDLQNNNSNGRSASKYVLFYKVSIWLDQICIVATFLQLAVYVELYNRVNILYFTSTSLVTSHESNARFVFVLQACFHPIHLCVGPHPSNPLNPKGANKEKALLSCDVSTKVLVKSGLYSYFTMSWDSPTLINKSAPQSKNTVYLQNKI